MGGTDEQAPNPLASPRFIVAAIAMAALVVGLAWVIVDHRAGDAPAAEAASPSASTSAPASGASPTGTETAESAPAGGAESACGLAAADASVPSAAIPSVPVEVGERLSVPSLEGAGPGVTSGISHCFAHTPTGAVLAAANFLTWFSSQQQLPDVVASLMADSPDRANLAAQVQAGWSGQTTSPLEVRGFRFEDRGPDNALVVLAVSSTVYPDQLAAWPVPLTWKDGDWLVVAPASDSWGERAIGSLEVEGFIEWGA